MMLVLNFFAGSDNASNFKLLYKPPLSNPTFRFINSKDDSISKAVIHINDVEFNLILNDSTAYLHNKEYEAIEFTLSLTEDEKASLDEINKGAYVKLDNKRIEQEIEVHITK